MRIKVFVIAAKTRPHGEIRGRYTPTEVRVERSSCRLALAYLRWDKIDEVSRPEVDLNAERSRFHHDVVPTAVHVERRAIGRATIGEGDATSCVGVDGSIAVGVEGLSVGIFKKEGSSGCVREHGKGDLPRLRLAIWIGRHLTPWSSMQSGLICLLQIDTYTGVYARESLRRETRDEKHAFDDVNFTAIGPRACLAQSPKGGPGGTARGHVRKVEYEYRLVVRGLRRNTDAITPPSARCNDGPIIGTHNKCTVLH